MKRLYHARKGRICVLVSGGLDSAVLLGELARRSPRVYPVYVKQGLAWEPVELYWLHRFLHALKNPRIQPLETLLLPMGDVYRRHWSIHGKGVPGPRSKDEAVYLPGRNLVLLVKAAIFCALHEISKMALGSLGHNPFPDATPAFFRLWSRTLSLGLKSPLKIEAPYRSLSKVDVIRRGEGLPLELSFSCISPVGKKHCGRCNKCAERKKAFRKAGIEDKTLYSLARPKGGRGRG